MDSERLSIRAMVEFIPQITVTVDALLHKYGGQQLSRTFNCIEDEFGWVQPDGFETRFRARVAELIETKLEAFDGVHDTLAKLDMPICLATNAPRKKIDHVLTKTKLDRFFPKHIFSAYEIGA